MRALVTGATGFIGSHLSAALLEEGWSVRGVDRRAPIFDHVQFEPLRCDLRNVVLEEMVADVDAVFHLAGRPGVRTSWGPDFESYVDDNLLVTHRLLEACRGTGLSHFVYSSSSSVYGEPRTEEPLDEAQPTNPKSPYGISKLAAEQLCGLYAAAFSVPVTSLRYFTVYGPRQREDMAFRRLIDAGLNGAPFFVLGDGKQRRDFTFVGDVVAANLAVTDSESPVGGVYNVAAGRSVPLSDAIDVVEDLLGASIDVAFADREQGDVTATSGSIDAARRDLGWAPTVSIEEGLAAQVAWQRNIARGTEA